jgi:hypothetical protein
MEVDLKAFISYRRHDSFMQSPADVTKPDFGFLDKLTAALSDAGFANVFVDRSAVKPGNNYESRIYQAIAD